MKRTKLFCGMFLFCLTGLLAQVSEFKGILQLDGRLEEPSWLACPLLSGFTRLEAANTSLAPAPTEFRVAADADHLYIGFRCEEPQMNKLVAPADGPPWSVDSIELFMAPTGQPDEYYQFLVTAGNMRWCMYYAESGNIRPDPYAPLWDSAVFHGPDFWSAEVRIPLSGFYMTRTPKWSREWLFNVGRCRRPVNESSSWSPLQVSFHETARFKRLNGFPLRSPASDLFLQSVQAKISAAGQNLCELELEILADPAAAGKYSVACQPPGQPDSRTFPLSLHAGINRLALPAIPFATSGKNDFRFEFFQAGTDKPLHGRIFPVKITHQPIAMAFDKPAYAKTFFPGQDRSEICGRLELQLEDAVLAEGNAFLEMEGGGLPRQTLVLKPLGSSLPFRFATPGLGEGEVLLKAEIRTPAGKAATVEARIRIPAPVSRRMVWLENGHLVINGKPAFPRDLYAVGYQGGIAFKERFEADNLHISGNNICILEPFRLVNPAIEQEAVKDIRPSQIVFDKIAARMESMRDQDFTFYYLSDEPECRGLSAVYFRHLYEFVKEKDPFHPVLIGSRAVAEFSSCADVISTHPYIGPMQDGRGKRFLNVPLHRVRDFIRPVSELRRPDKMIGITPQFFSYGNLTNYLADYPTFPELECSIWSAIANGARMVWAYAYHDLGDRPTLYEGMRYLYGSIETLEPILLSGKPRDVVLESPDKAMLDVQLLESEITPLLLLVNLQEKATTAVISAATLRPLKELHSFREQRTFPLQQGSLSVELAPYQVLILTAAKVDQGLEPRTDFLNRLENGEKARGERGNLLFGKGFSLEIDSSGEAPRNRLWQQGKLFDGTLDMMGWCQYPGRPEAWFEVSFPKWVPEFSRVRLYGNGLQNATIRIWKAGDWQTPEPDRLQENKYLREWNFPRPLRTVKIRFDFTPAKPGDILELYEIELMP